MNTTKQPLTAKHGWEMKQEKELKPYMPSVAAPNIAEQCGNQSCKNCLITECDVKTKSDMRLPREAPEPTTTTTTMTTTITITTTTATTNAATTTATTTNTNTNSSVSMYW